MLRKGRILPVQRRVLTGEMGHERAHFEDVPRTRRLRGNRLPMPWSPDLAR